MAYVKSFKGFQSAEKKAADEVTTGANPQMIKEEGVPTDPALLTQYNNLQKEKSIQIQLNTQKATQDKKVLDLQTAYDAAVTKTQAAQKNAEANQPAPAQPAAPATPAAPTA
jgi:hypothetical protein